MFIQVPYLNVLCIGVQFSAVQHFYATLFSDYIELAIQFGFATLFSSAFPLAPLCAFLNNLFEIRLDAQKYTKYKMRTVPTRNRYPFLTKIHPKMVILALKMVYISKKE